jgi:hypothetical protein
MCIHAAFTVLIFPRRRADDLTSAVLYKPGAQTYYPIALLLWREKLRKLFRNLPHPAPPIRFAGRSRAVIFVKVQQVAR